MNSAILRKWGGTVAVSLPKKVLALLGLQAGSEVEIRAESGNIVLSPAKPKFSLNQLVRQQTQHERKHRNKRDSEWLDGPARGRELL